MAAILCLWGLGLFARSAGLEIMFGSLGCNAVCWDLGCMVGGREPSSSLRLSFEEDSRDHSYFKAQGTK